VANLERILAIELTCAARGLDLRRPLEPGAGTGAALAALREGGVPGPGSDRWLAPELEAARDVIASGDLTGAVSSAIGALA
jgi:histidine ammonia-lyase